MRSLGSSITLVSFMHPSGMKMYHDLRRRYYSSGIKKNVEDFVRQCLACQLVKVNYQRPTGLL